MELSHQDSAMACNQNQDQYRLMANTLTPIFKGSINILKKQPITGKVLKTSLEVNLAMGALVGKAYPVET